MVQAGAVSLAEEAAPAPRPLPRGCGGGRCTSFWLRASCCVGAAPGSGLASPAGVAGFVVPAVLEEATPLWPVTLNTGLSVDEEYRLVSSFSCVRFLGFVPIT